MKSTFILIIVLFCLFVSCTENNKQSAMNGLCIFVEKVDANAHEYTDEDWLKIDNEYFELIAEIDKYEYSGDDLKRIAELKGKYAGIKTKNEVNKFFDKIDKTAKKVKGAIEGFKDGIIGRDDSQNRTTHLSQV